MMKTLYAWANGSAYALNDEQQARLVKAVAKGSAQGAHMQLHFADDDASFRIAFSEDWNDRALRTLALRLNAERQRWACGDSEVVISDSATPEDLATLNARHLAIAQTA